MNNQEEIIQIKNALKNKFGRDFNVIYDDFSIMGKCFMITRTPNYFGNFRLGVDLNSSLNFIEKIDPFLCNIDSMDYPKE